MAPGPLESVLLAYFVLRYAPKRYPTVMISGGRNFSRLFLLFSSSNIMSSAFILESRNKTLNACSDPMRISCALNDRLENISVLFITVA